MIWLIIVGNAIAERLGHHIWRLDEPEVPELFFQG